MGSEEQLLERRRWTRRSAPRSRGAWFVRFNYFPTLLSKLNCFQLVLAERSDLIIWKVKHASKYNKIIIWELSSGDPLDTRSSDPKGCETAVLCSNHGHIANGWIGDVVLNAMSEDPTACAVRRVG